MHDATRDSIKIAIAAELLGCQTPDTFDSLEQLLRARIDPNVHTARYKLHNQLTSSTTAVRRRFADAVRPETLQRLHPDTQKFVDAYTADVISVEEYIEFVLFLSVFDTGLFDELMIVCIALLTHLRFADRLNRVGLDTPLTEQNVWKEYQSLIAELWQQKKQDVPLLMYHIEPIVVSTTTGTFLLSGRINLFDTLSGEYTITLDQPRRVRSFTASPHTVIPWHDAQTGILLHMSFPDQHSWYHEPVQMMISSEQLLQFKNHGSAIPLRIGHGQDIAIHSDIFPEYVSFGTSPIATFRLLTSGVEIRKTHPDLALTLLA